MKDLSRGEGLWGGGMKAGKKDDGGAGEGKAREGQGREEYKKRRKDRARMRDLEAVDKGQGEETSRARGSRVKPKRRVRGARVHSGAQKQRDTRRWTAGR
jgi:hypothetical protein